jgi:hypothetical protein
MVDAGGHCAVILACNVRNEKAVAELDAIEPYVGAVGRVQRSVYSEEAIIVSGELNIEEREILEQFERGSCVALLTLSLRWRQHVKRPATPSTRLGGSTCG